MIHEDEFVLVIDKPSPLAVHPVGSYAELNLHSLLKKDERWKDKELRFVHRLDAETSGVVVIAKTPEAARYLGIQFLKGQVRKKYHAIVFGSPKDKEGKIDLPLGNDKSSGFQTLRIIDREKGQPSTTRYRVLETNGDYSVLEVEPLTGRTHQIRAHLSFIGHPVVGDKIYIDLGIFQRYVTGGLDAEMLQRLKLPRLALHASWVSFKHPGTGEEAEYSSALPDFFKEMPK